MEDQRYKELADFLKTRRNRISPTQVGLPKGIRRRTPGLRREEVAQLAGIGLTWYTWLEQGRPIQVSVQVLESLSRVLLLTRQEQNHLFSLAQQPLPAEDMKSLNAVNESLQNVLDSLVLSPSYIIDNKWNVIAWNKASSFVFGDFSKITTPERNIVWMMFANQDYMSLFADWAYHAQGLLARFRATSSQNIGNSWFLEFVYNLRQKSKAFDTWWSQHDVHSMSEIIKEIEHPIVHKLVFEFNSFDVSSDPSLKLMIHTPLKDTGTYEKLGTLINSTLPPS